MSLPRINYSKDGTKLYRYNFSTNTKAIISSDDMSVLDSDIYTANQVSFSSNSLMFNFPSSINIDKVGVKFNQPSRPSGWQLSYSADSTDGIDGTWIDVPQTFSHTNNTYTEWEILLNSIKWLRLPSADIDGACYNIFIFGEYENSTFEIWDANGSGELNTEVYPFGITGVTSYTDYSDKKQFKIKNKTDFTKNYNITISPVRYGGDSIISNYFSLSLDGGTTKASNITLYNVEPGAFSAEVVDIWTDLLSTNNPGDGYHYYSILIEEV